MKIVLASGNANKYAEMKEAFEPIGVSLLYGGDFKGSLHVEENGATYRDNALLKARAWLKATGIASISDDSGLEVEALGGAPGVHSARIVPGSDADRTKWLLEQLKAKDNRRARFVACLAVVFPDGREPLVCEKYCPGQIAEEPSGVSGFGYDPVFIPDGYGKTFAELGREIKTKISHRALAIKEMTQILKPVIQYYAVRNMEKSPPEIKE